MTDSITPWSAARDRDGAGLLAGRRALITGAGSGIGAATALRFAEDGARVCVSDLDLGRLEQVVETLNSAGHQVEQVAMDVADDVMVADAVRRASHSLGGLDTVVANAGRFSLGRFEEASASELRKVIDVNVVGVFNVFQASINELRVAGGESYWRRPRSRDFGDLDCMPSTVRRSLRLVVSSSASALSLPIRELESVQ